MIPLKWKRPTAEEPVPRRTPILARVDQMDTMVCTVSPTGAIWEHGDSRSLQGRSVDDIPRYIELDTVLEAIVDGEEYDAAWAQYLEIRKQLRRGADDAVKQALIDKAMNLGRTWGFDEDQVEIECLRSRLTDPARVERAAAVLRTGEIETPSGKLILTEQLAARVAARMLEAADKEG